MKNCKHINQNSLIAAFFTLTVISKLHLLCVYAVGTA